MATGGWRPRVREWWLEFSGIGDVLGTLDRIGDELDRIGDELDRQTRESVRLRQEMVEDRRRWWQDRLDELRRDLRDG